MRTWQRTPQLLPSVTSWRVVEPGNPCNGDSRRATVYCLTVTGNRADLRSTQTSFSGTYEPGAQPLGWRGTDGQPKPDYTYSAQGDTVACPTTSGGAPTLFLLQGSIVITDR